MAKTKDTKELKAFTRKSAKQMRAEIAEALTTALPQYRILWESGRVQVNGRNATFHIDATLPEDDGTYIDKYVSFYLLRAAQHGLGPKDLGREVVLDGTRYVLSGMYRGSRDYPFVLTDPSTGERKKAPAAAVVSQLRSQGKENARNGTS